jgi:hypothetical protein
LKQFSSAIFRAAVFCPLVMAAGCAHQPMDYMPQNEKDALGAQAHLGLDGGGQGAGAGHTDVAGMLAAIRARDGDQAGLPAFSGATVLIFRGSDVQPDESQRMEIRQAAAGLHGPVEVSGHSDGVGGDHPLLGERRVLAVAKDIIPAAGAVTVRFDQSIPDGTVRIAPRGAPAADP